jgi:hypothetical protein
MHRRPSPVFEFTFRHFTAHPGLPYVGETKVGGRRPCGLLRSVVQQTLMRGFGNRAERVSDDFLFYFILVGGRRGKDAYATGVGSPPDNSAPAPPTIAKADVLDLPNESPLCGRRELTAPARNLSSRAVAPRSHGLMPKDNALWITRNEARPIFNCAQFCAHHQTLPSVIECRGIAGNPCWARHL